MHLPRHARRTAALVAALAALTAPVLSSCGFDAATGRINNLAAGVNDRTGQIDILGAVIVATGPSTGVFEATLSNNVPVGAVTTTSTASSTTSAGTAEATAGTAEPQDLPPGADQLVSIAGGTDGGLQATEPIKPFVIQPSAAVNLFRDNLGIAVKGTWGNPGPFVTVELSFASGQHNTLEVPVVRPCNAYADIVATPSSGASDAGVGGSDADTDPFSCDPETQPTQTGSAAAGDE